MPQVRPRIRSCRLFDIDAMSFDQFCAKLEKPKTVILEGLIRAFNEFMRTLEEDRKVCDEIQDILGENERRDNSYD